jgi:hypothetical protein
VGLLEKSLKKAGKTRTPAVKPAKVAEEKRSVGWLSGSFGERTSALADKIDLEAQYARLEAMSESHAVAPPKMSLRERALRMLTGSAATKPMPQSGVPATAPTGKRSLRDRAAQFMRKLTGGGSGESGAAGGSPESSGGISHTHAGGDDSHGLSHSSEHDPHDRTLFPWWALAGGEHGDGLHSVFGHEPAEPIPVTTAPTAEAEVAAPEPAPVQRSPLEDFAETISRITDNLKNLHGQLDSGNFIRNIQVQGAEPPAAPAPSLISHHVTVEGDAPVAAELPAREGELRAAGAQQQTPKEAARDVFWPRELPLDLPARDVRVNADGTVSVVPGPFQLPYLAEDIASSEGDLSHFTRNLKSAELFIGEGELQLTRIIYERLLAKIIDDEAKRKIKANLDALDNYRKSHDWGSFMPIPPWMRNNPWQDMKPPQLSVSEMPVEAKNITINLDKGFFEIAKAIFEQQKELMQSSGDEKKEDASAEGTLAEETGSGDEGADEERRADDDRRKGAPDPRGEGAVDRRSGKDRRAESEEAAAEPGEERQAPPPLAADGATQAPESPAEKPVAAAPDELPDEPLPDGVMEPPKIPEMSPDGQAMAPNAGGDDDGAEGDKEEENKVQEIRGVLELKTPDQEDTPFLTLTYDFTKIPHAYRLAKDNGIFEYAYYKYKPMLVKAHQFIRRKQITRALNYYRVIREQQIPTEFRHMVDRNIRDITEYLQKYLVTRAN